MILLAGFALENIIKAYLIYEHPEYVKGGFLSKKIQTHKLTNLVKGSSLIPYQSKGLNTLKYYEDGLESWARYPCGLNWAQTKEQRLLSEKDWKCYLWLMSAMDTYKRRSGRAFPTWSEVLEVIRSLGYRKVEAPSEIIMKSS